MYYVVAIGLALAPEALEKSMGQAEFLFAAANSYSN